LPRRLLHPNPEIIDSASPIDVFLGAPKAHGFDTPNSQFPRSVFLRTNPICGTACFASTVGALTLVLCYTWQANYYSGRRRGKRDSYVQSNQAHQLERVAPRHNSIPQLVVEAHFAAFDVILKMHVADGIVE